MAIKLEKEFMDQLIPSVQNFFTEEFDTEIGDLRARLILDYVVKEIGPTLYNKGVSDSEQYFREKVEDLKGSCFEPELTYWKKR